jgi:chorismate mutase
MNPDPNPLDALRREIDEIDREIQTLLGKRADVVEQVANSKVRDGGHPMRPGREAILLRERLAAATEKVPRIVVSRIWREIIASSCRAQGPLTIAVCAPEKSVGYWDLARDHFGSATPMSLHKSPQLVVRAVGEGAATVGLLPVPEEGDAEPWWRYMAGAGPDGPRIIARLPFCGNPGARFENLEALAVAQLDIDESGDDVSFLVVPASDKLSRASFNGRVQDAGLDGHIVGAYEEGAGLPRLYLVEVAGFVATGDPRISKLVDRLGDQGGQVFAIGGYAKPLGDES